MHEEPSSVQLIISQSEVSGIPNTFSIGCYAKRVTFHSQQNRALNLIWALFEKTKISKDSSVAIVGGGLAGMTAAIAAKSKGCSVTIFETEDDFMPIQRGNNTRYIHPHIYDWPTEGCEVGHTDLPFLNWKAGDTSEVIQQIEKEWESSSSGINVKKSTKVGRIFGMADKPYLTFNKGSETEGFDAVILAVGFGEEKPVENVAMTLYWTSDGLHQRPIRGATKTFLVSGCGDGGLIDVLRLAIKNFNHKSFTDHFLKAEFSKIHNDLLKIDAEAPEDPERASVYLGEQYKKLDVPPELEKFIASNLRTNTQVTLNGRTPTFLTTQSSILNRYAVYLIMRAKKISYQHGEISVSKIKEKYSVTFKSSPTSLIEHYDDVVVRHGPEQVIGRLTGQDLPHYNSDKTDVTAKKLWIDGFYTPETEAPNTTTTTTMAPACMRDVAYEHIDELKTELMGLKYFSGCFVGGTEAAPEYLVKLSSKTIPVAYKLYKTFRQIPITFTFEQKFKYSMSNYTDFVKNSLLENDILCSGMPIRNKDLRNAAVGTLGCFVLTPSGMPGILCTSHVLSPKGENEGAVVASGFKESKEKIVADLSFGVRLFARKGTKAVETEVNLVDAAIATLRNGIRFSTHVPLPNDKIVFIRNIAESKPGDIVFKYSFKNGLTSGRVEAVNGMVMVEYANLKRYFNGVIMVQSVNDQPFSKEGDSGSLVYNSEGEAVGIVFAVGQSRSIICPLSSILKELNCTLFVN